MIVLIFSSDLRRKGGRPAVDNELRQAGGVTLAFAVPEESELKESGGFNMKRLRVVLCSSEIWSCLVGGEASADDAATKRVSCDV